MKKQKWVIAIKSTNEPFMRMFSFVGSVDDVCMKLNCMLVNEYWAVHGNERRFINGTNGHRDVKDMNGSFNAYMVFTDFSVWASAEPIKDLEEA